MYRVAFIFFFARTFTKHYIMKEIHVEDCKSSEDNVLKPWLIGTPICSFLVGYNNSSSESRIGPNACCQTLELGFQASVFLRVQCGLSCHQWDLAAATVSCFHFVRHTLTEELNMLLTDRKAILHQQHPLCCMYYFYQAFIPILA